MDEPQQHGRCNRKRHKKIGDYIGKYVQKEVDEETEETTTKKVKYWGKSQIIEQLKYPTIEENQLDKITLEQLQKNTIKTITKDNKYICTIIQEQKCQEAMIPEHLFGRMVDMM